MLNTAGLNSRHAYKQPFGTLQYCNALLHAPSQATTSDREETIGVFSRYSLFLANQRCDRYACLERLCESALYGTILPCNR